MIKYFKNIIRYNFPNLVFLYKRFRHQEFYYDDFLYDITKLSKNKNFNLSISGVPVIFDVGSHHGFGTLNFLNRVQNSIIHCFEPSVASCEILQKELIGYKGVKLNCLAFGEKKEDSKLYTYKGAHNLNRMKENAVLHIGGVSSGDLPIIEDIKVDTLDNYCQKNEIDKIDILRVDTNTNNFAVLKGSLKTLEAKKIKYINVGIYKINNKDDDTGSLAEIDLFMTSLGYRLATLYNGFIHPIYSAGYYTATYIIDHPRDEVK